MTGFMMAASLSEAFYVDLSAHCAPALHRHLGMAATRFWHCEWFHDHVRIEQMLIDGAPVLHDGAIMPAPDKSGFELVFKKQDARRFTVGTGS